MEEEFVLISSERLQNLLDAESELDSLEAAGVDNWEGYSDVDWEEVFQEQTTNADLVKAMSKYNSMGKRLN